MDHDDNGKTVPITILTGFLGAGKTTLLNRILTGNHGLRVGVLVNDFGSINIDAELVVGVDNNMISLANGCVCCQIRDDLVESVAALLARPETVEYILLEASGVADPAGIFVTFNDPNLRDRIRLDSVTCVMDADQVFAHPEYPPLMDLKLRQVGFADMLILNKVDLAGPEQGREGQGLARRPFQPSSHRRDQLLRGALRDPFGCRAFRSCSSRPQLARRLSIVAPTRAAMTHDGDHEHDHSKVFSTWSYETDHRWRWKRCGKQCVSCRELFTGPKGWSTPPTRHSGGRCCKWSADAWTSHSKRSGASAHRARRSWP